MKQITRTADGRAHLLALVADSERNDEGRIFAALEQRSSDPWLQKVARRHSADETRHAALLEARIVANGTPRPQLPKSIDALHHLDLALEGVMSNAIVTNEDVMRAYLLLQVIEERAISQLPLFIEAFRSIDPVSCSVFETLHTDEQRHLKYCHAVARRYAPSAAIQNETLRHFRKVEAKVFARLTMSNLAYVIEAGLLTGFEWRALSFVGARYAPARGTGFTDLREIEVPSLSSVLHQA